MSNCFMSAWHDNAELIQGLACEILTVDSDFSEFVKIKFDVIMLDTSRNGLNYRSEIQSIWVDINNYAPICPLTCLLNN